MKKKEWLLIVFSAVSSLLLALGLVRWFAPQLLGIPVDLQMVRVSKEVPPFFDNVFPAEDTKQNFIIQDPYIMRARPLFPRFLRMGPNDILGFRNKSVPNIVDIITIGDSQTYGNNVVLEANWPSVMAANMEHFSPVLYNMSVGGWGAAEYFEIFNKGLYLQPKVVIVAFYTGNDAIDTFKKVYADERWESLRLNAKITSSDVPTVSENNEWAVKFSDGLEITFTPNLRYVSNRRDSPAVLVGYEIIGKLAQKMGEIAEKSQVKLVFTIIPTKELVFKKKIMMENITPREDYANLVKDEDKNLEELAEKLRGIKGAVYVDLLGNLQNAIIESKALYSSGKDGHPVADGYKLIGKTLLKETVKLLPDKLKGGVAAKISVTDDNYRTLLVKNNYFYKFSSIKIAEENGWNRDNIKVVSLRDINKFSYGGIIKKVNPSQFGPEAFSN